MKTPSTQRTEWQTRVDIGLPELDAERKKIIELLGQLDMKPLYSIADEEFLERFSVIRHELRQFAALEENILKRYHLPYKTRRMHADDHSRIAKMLDEIYDDALAKKNQTVLAVFQLLKNEIIKHMLAFNDEIRSHIQETG